MNPQGLIETDVRSQNEVPEELHREAAYKAHLGMEAREFHLPLDKCRLYTGIPMRFETDIELLGESIHNHGQQEPGIAVEQGDHYLVPDGRRRLLGCRYAKYYYGGPIIYWATVYHDLDEVQMFTIAFIKNADRESFSLLDEFNYFREAKKRFGTKVAAEIGIRAGREVDYMRKLVEVCSLIEGKLVKLHKIETMTEYRFRLSDLENLSTHRSESEMFYRAAAAVAAARLMNPQEAESSEIRTLVRYYAPWFNEVFPEFSTGSQATTTPFPKTDFSKKIMGTEPR